MFSFRKLYTLIKKLCQEKKFFSFVNKPSDDSLNFYNNETRESMKLGIKLIVCPQNEADIVSQ